MKQIITFIAASILTACSTPPAESSGGGMYDLASTSVIHPEPASIGVATPVTCAPVVGTYWIAYGIPTFTPASNDQAGHSYYISEFNLSGNDDHFTESQWAGIPLGYMTCRRSFSAGVPMLGSQITSLKWLDTGGYCGNVISWLKFDTNECNVMTVQFLVGDGSLYLTQTYKPNN